MHYANALAVSRGISCFSFCKQLLLFFFLHSAWVGWGMHNYRCMHESPSKVLKIKTQETQNSPSMHLILGFHFLPLLDQLLFMYITSPSIILNFAPSPTPTAFDTTPGEPSGLGGAVRYPHRHLIASTAPSPLGTLQEK